MYVDPYQFICKTDTHTNKSCARNQIWTGDTRIFSPLLYQLSYPDHSWCIILILLEDLGLCQLKGRRDITKSYPGPGISRSSKGRLCKFQYSYWYGPRIIQMEIPCSKMLICTCIIYITRPIKKFPIGSVCERVEWMRKITNFEPLTKKKYS